MQKTHPLFSIVYVNYNSAAYLEKSLESLFAFETPALFEIIIVNNDIRENERVAQIATRFSCKCIQNAENKGFGTAVNQGVEEASSPWVGLLNPDTLWPKAQLTQLGERIWSQDIVFGLTLLDENAKRECFGSGRTITLLQLLLNHLSWLPKKEEIGWISGGALFFPRKTWEELGGFDETYFLYYEDVDFCERARRIGKKLAVYSDFSVTHFRGKSHTSPKKQKKYYRASQAYYFTKFRPWYEQKLLQLLFIFSSRS